jgi:hypothetical protein
LSISPPSNSFCGISCNETPIYFKQGIKPGISALYPGSLNASLDYNILVLLKLLLVKLQ